MAEKAKVIDLKDRTDDVILKENVDFKSLLLPPNILKGILKKGFLKPSPIQYKAIPLARAGNDIIVQSKAGTGKTCIFTVVALEEVKVSKPVLQALILAPTREIASQIKEAIKSIGVYMKEINVQYFVGGIPFGKDIEKSKECHIAVGTPGRILHLIKDGHLSLTDLCLLVFDEADKLMDISFRTDILEIYNASPKGKQIIACSATYTPEMLTFLENGFNLVMHVTPNNGPEIVLIGVKQFVSILHPHDNHLALMKEKEKRLLHLLNSIWFNQCIIFTNYSSRAQSICNFLDRNDWPVAFISSRQKQWDRFTSLKNLRNQLVRVLVSTDITARGIDQENVNLVINMDMPLDSVTYIHRMGRAGRYGSYGVVISIIMDGVELAKFKTMLGCIGGGSTFSVNILPHDVCDDLISINDIDSFAKLNFNEPAEQKLNDYSTNKLLSDNVNTNKNSELNLQDNAEAADFDITTNQAYEKNREVDSNCSSANNVDKVQIIHVSCKCRKLQINPESIVEITDKTLYTINGDYNLSNKMFPVCKGKLPLNVPLVVSKGKLIRLQKLKNFKPEIKFNYNINILSKCLDQFSNGIYKLSLKEPGVFNKEEKVHLLKYMIEEENKKEVELLKLHNVIKTYDLLGWLIVDSTSNFVEDIQSDNPEIIKLKLSRCQAGKMHIEPLKLGSLNSYLSKQDEDANVINMHINYAFDITVMLPELLNSSFSDILNYFNKNVVGDELLEEAYYIPYGDNKLCGIQYPRNDFNKNLVDDECSEECYIPYGDGNLYGIQYPRNDSDTKLVDDECSEKACYIHYGDSKLHGIQYPRNDFDKNLVDDEHSEETCCIPCDGKLHGIQYPKNDVYKNLVDDECSEEECYIPYGDGKLHGIQYPRNDSDTKLVDDECSEDTKLVDDECAEKA